MITIDGDRVIIEEAGARSVLDIGSPEAFRILSRVWLRSGWDNKYVYSFTWLGRPIVQLPDDLVRIQEVIYRVRPDVIIETGVAHGGSLVFYATLCHAMAKGRVVGIDLEIRPHNKKAIDEHPLRPLITLIEGDSIASDTVKEVRSQIHSGEKVIVLLDSCHSKDHVLAELRAYSELVSPGSYIVAMDGIMEEVAGAPYTQPDWTWNNPRRAALEFVQDNLLFVIDEPKFLFNESNINERRVTYWPGAFIKRLAAREDLV